MDTSIFSLVSSTCSISVPMGVISTSLGWLQHLRMYGAGKLLLKDTVLEMKANRRYGVVGHNGAPSSRWWKMCKMSLVTVGVLQSLYGWHGLLGKASTHVQG